jgi:lipopolysaccharide export LptBFGC system permease protein LptF
MIVNDRGYRVPGTVVRRLLSAVCSPDTVMRIVEPVLADWQVEAAGARSGLTLAWLRCRWLLALVSALALDAVRGPTSADERRYANRVWGAMMVGCLAVVALGLASSISVAIQTARLGGRPALAVELLALLLPACLSSGLPCGVLLGALSWPGAGRTRRRSLIFASVCAAVVTLALLAFVVPSSNQRYRELSYRAVTANAHAFVAPGEREMSFGELRRLEAWYRLDGRLEHAAVYAVARQQRLALAAACLFAGWCLGALAGTRVSRAWWLRVPVAASVALAWLGLFSWGSVLVTRLTVDSAWTVWLPNLLLGAGAVAVHMAGHRRGLEAP